MGTGEPSQNARDELASQEFRKFGDGCASAFRAIPPTSVGGSFKPNLQRRAHSNFPEFHPRQWVDRSSAAYNQRDHKLLAIVLYGQRLNLKHPPTAVGGIPGAATPLSCRPGLNKPPTAVGGITRKDDAHAAQSPRLFSNLFFVMLKGCDEPEKAVYGGAG